MWKHSDQDWLGAFGQDLDLMFAPHMAAPGGLGTAIPETCQLKAWHRTFTHSACCAFFVQRVCGEGREEGTTRAKVETAVLLVCIGSCDSTECTSLGLAAHRYDLMRTQGLAIRA